MKTTWIWLSSLLLSAIPVSANACSQWSAAGQYHLDQGNGPHVAVTVVQNGRLLSGTARYSGHTGRIGGTLNGNLLRMTVNWNGAPSLGVYQATVNPYGAVGGDTWDALKPGASHSTFVAIRNTGSFPRNYYFVCIVGQGLAPPP